MSDRSPITDYQSPDYYTLGDLLAHWERGEITLEEVIAHWPHDGMTNDELLREILRALLSFHKRILVLESGR